MNKMTTKDVDNNIKKKKEAEAKANRRGKKEDAVDKPSSEWPLCSQLKRDDKEWRTYTTTSGKKTTLKKGENWNTKYNGDADYYGGPHAKPCFIEHGKKSGMANPDTKPCPDDGRATSATCSPPPPPPAKKTYCSCYVKSSGANKWIRLVSEGSKAKTYDWSKKYFRGFYCQGCEYVKVEDND